jgi:RNA polymerase sigma-70 factor (ECF subfamily)
MTKQDDNSDIEQGIADAKLVRQTLAGDDSAFEVLVRRYKSLMVLVAYRQCGNESDSEDAAQEALYRAYRQLAKLDDPARFRSWAMRITSNAALDLMRRRKKTVSIDDERLPPDMVTSEAAGDDAGEAAEQEETRRLIVEAIESLPEPYHLCAVLRYIEELPYRDMAERLGLREDALRKRIHRANQMLRKKLKPLMGDSD